METTLKGWLQSSQDPTAVANTIKGLVLAASSVIIFSAMQFFHVQVSASDVASLATEIGALAGAMWTIYGIIMKVVVWVGSNKV